MIEVGIDEARKRFLELMEKVGEGETVLVTRNGQPLAEIVASEAARRARVEGAMARIEALRQSLKGRFPPTSIDDIIAMKNEGRRY